MFLYALVVVAFIAGSGPDAQIGEFFKTEKECLAAVKVFETEVIKKEGLHPRVEAIGLNCVKVGVAPGKPV